MLDKDNTSFPLPFEEQITSLNQTIASEDIQIQIEEYRNKTLHIWRICSPIILREFTIWKFL